MLPFRTPHLETKGCGSKSFSKMIRRDEETLGAFECISLPQNEKYLTDLQCEMIMFIGGQFSFRRICGYIAEFKNMSTKSSDESHLHHFHVYWRGSF